MDKQRLMKLKKLNKEARMIQNEIKNFECKPREYVADTVKDYSSGYARIITIEGYGDAEYKKAKDKLYGRLMRKLKEIQEEREEIEDFLDSIDDVEIRTILRLQYINGMTQEQIAYEIGYDERTIRRRLKKFWESVL